MSKVKEIFLAWRPHRGDRRRLVANLIRDGEGILFSYQTAELKQAKREGFDFYPGFRDPNKYTSLQAKYLLAMRTIKKGHPFWHPLLDFWEAREQDDVFDILAYTQGRSPTDDFEFLARFEAEKGLRFTTDIAGLSYSKLEPGFLKVGDRLGVKLEPSNQEDKGAVAVYKGDSKIGYVKQVHNLCFKYSNGLTPTLTVKDLGQNGIIKEVFVKVEFG